ncbi:MAG: IS1634 family transposase [Promethearchaeota archaeon]|nr:MAG: IS1634 family transposase [Candidatus Lokiarchaeota archaeon]
MNYSLHVSKTKHGNYYSYRYNYRENGKVKTHDIYLGPEERAVKIISDFNSKKPLNERHLSFSGEVLLLKMLEMVNFKKIVNKNVQNEAEFDVGHFIEMLLIEHTLYEHSKWRLANVSHAKSIFSLDRDISPEKFHEKNIYRYMDYIYPELDKIQKEIVNMLFNIKEMEFDELIIDATSMHCFGADEIEEPRNEVEKYKQVNRLHGYSRSKRPDLPQVNLILGVTEHYIPLIFNAFSGNAPDTAMFKVLLEKCQREYPMLLKKIKGKYVVFDKGNNSEDNFKELDGLCEEWGCCFVTSVRPSLISVKNQLIPLQIEEEPVIYEQQHTKLRGKTSTVFLYAGDKMERKVLLYVNEEIAKKRQEEFKELLTEVQAKVSEINQKKSKIEDKKKSIETFLRGKRVISLFKRELDNGTIKCVPIQNKVDEKFNLSGKFAIVTNDFNLDAKAIIRIYKTSGVVEHSFHILKSVLALYPFRHWKKERIKVHCALGIWGAMAFALLRLLLKQHGLEFTFEQLKEIVTTGYFSIGDYVYPGYKSFRIQRILNLNPVLENIFKVFKLNFEYFDIKLLPTVMKKN